MTYEGDGGETNVPRRHTIPHYHGDGTRALFVASAIILVVAKSTGAEIPLSTTVAIIVAVMLVVAAGVTNPAQSGSHGFTALFAAVGTLLFGITAVDHYNAGMGLLDPSFIYVEILAVLSLIALYLTTRTIRGMYMRSES